MKSFNTILIVLLATVFVVYTYGILQHGPLPQSVQMVSSSAVLLLACIAHRISHRPLISAFVVCLMGFPGVLVAALILNKVGAFDGLSESGHATLNSIVSGMTGGGGIGILFVALLCIFSGIRRSGGRHPNKVNS